MIIKQNGLAPPLFDAAQTKCHILSKFGDIAWPPTRRFLRKQSHNNFEAFIALLNHVGTA